MSEPNGRQAARDRGTTEGMTKDTTPVAVGIAVHHGPISGMALRPDGRRLLVTNYADDSVSVVDTDTFRVVDTVEGWPSRSPSRSAVPPAGHTSAGGNELRGLRLHPGH